MRKNRLLLIVLAMMPGSFALAQSAPCQLEIQPPAEVSWRGLYGRGYEASSPEASEPIPLVIRHTGEACRFFLTVSDVSGMKGASGILSYDVQDSPSGRSLASPDPLGAPGTRVTGYAGENDTDISLPLYMTITPSQTIRAGSYAGTAILSIFRDEGTSDLIGQVPLFVSARVPPVLSVVSPQMSGGKSAAIDLGMLDDGASTQIDFSLTANVDVAVRLESANLGNLKHQTGLVAIPYRANIGGRSVDLSSAATERFSVPAGSSTDIPLRIDVGSQRGAAAGAYTDTMTITFTAD